MKPYLVRIPAGKWMAGIHRFKTLRAARQFAHDWSGVVTAYKTRPQILREEKSGARVPC